MNIRELALRANEEAQRLCELLLPNGKRVGKQWVCGDASGAAGDSMAVELDGPKRGQWYDHAAGIGGDMLKLVEVNRGLTPIKASDEVRKLLGLPAWTPERKNGPPPPDQYDACSKVWLVKSINRWVAPSKAWAYRNAMGKILAYVCRIDWEEGGKRKKDVIPQRLGEDGRWHWKGYKGDEKRPVYGLELLLKLNDGRALLIVEGEKTCDAARKHFPDVAVITWMGGCKNVQKAEWGPVENWKGPIAVWPDNDDEGQTAALYLTSRLAKAVKVKLPDGLPPKWDLADPIPSEVSIRGLLDCALAPERKKARVIVEPSAALTGEESGPDRQHLISELFAIGIGGGTQTEKGTKMGRAVTGALAERGRFFFHLDQPDFANAMYWDKQLKRLRRVREDGFLAWLSDWTQINRASNFWRFIAASVETEALHGKITKGILPEYYWAYRHGAFYLSSGDGNVYRITCDGIEEVDNGTDEVLFAAGKTLMPWRLTEPADPFQTCDIFSQMNCDRAHGPALLRAWVYSFPRNFAAKPPLCVAGDIGSGKTRTLKGVAELLGIPFVAMKVEDQREGDFWPNMDAGGLLTLDNVDSKVDWLPDAVAAMATDGCLRKRKLYTDSTLVTLRARSWLAITTANPTFASDSGLSDRLLVVRMHRRAPGKTSDQELTDQVLANRNAGLSHMAMTLRVAVGATDPVPRDINTRHPDFGMFGVRIGRALGREEETINALKAAEVDKSEFCISNDPIGAALQSAISAQGSVSGKASEICEILTAIDPELTKNLKPKRLAKRLALMWPHLERLYLAFKEEDRNHVLRYRFEVRPAGCAGFQPGIPENLA